MTLDGWASFRRAFEIAPHDAVRFNVAVCLERLGRFREAALEYDAAADSSALDEARRRRARALGNAARRRLGTLEVEGEPPGADVFANSDRLCALPCRVVVDPGRYELVVRTRAGEARDVVEVEPRAALHLRLATPEEPRWETAEARRGLGVLGWAGVVAAGVGVAGILYFGLRTQALHDEYGCSYSEETREQGILARDLTNVSIAVAILGGVAVGLDVFVLEGR